MLVLIKIQRPASFLLQNFRNLILQDLCQCLGTTDPDSITGLCLCYDHLDPKTPLDSSEDVLRELGNWWQRCVAGAGPDGHMTSDVYKLLVAR